MPKNSLADLIADLDSTAPKDYDPEDLVEPLNDNLHVKSDSENEDGEEKTGARDHYVSVGKSKLRSEQQQLMDDPRYAGKRTSRKDLFSDNEEEWEGMPEASGDSDQDASSNDDSNDDSDDLLEKSKNLSDDFEDSGSDEDMEEREDGEEDDDDDNDEEIDDEEEEEEDNEEDDGDNINDELRKIQEEEKQMISQLSKSAQSDVEKGQHVRQQLTLWDNSLENRIRMQKVIDDANKLPQVDSFGDFLAKTDAVTEDLQSATNDLREVIDDLMDIRTQLFEQNGSIDLSEQDFNKRKRYLDDDDEYLEKLWSDISTINDVFVPFRNSTLEKWSNKVQVAAGARLNKKFKAFDQNIMTQIDNILSDKAGLIKRTQLQRSDYKVIGKEVAVVEESEEDTGKRPDRHLNNYDTEIFDDQDFYQQQLRELIESRMVDTDDPMAIGMRWAARKQTEQKKKKKVVDRKASKGRKLRFNVHEKLQNFMAPIPSGHWHEEMIDELYTSLLGQRLKDNLEE